MSAGFSMHIFFTRFPLESQFGGAEVQTLSLMEGLKERGHHVAFLGSCPVLLEKCFALSVPYFDLNIGPPPVTKWHAISFLWRQFLMRKKLINAINEQPVTRNEQRVIFMLSLSEKLLNERRTQTFNDFLNDLRQQAKITSNLPQKAQ